VGSKVEISSLFCYVALVSHKGLQHLVAAMANVEPKFFPLTHFNSFTAHNVFCIRKNSFYLMDPKKFDVESVRISTFGYTWPKFGLIIQREGIIPSFMNSLTHLEHWKRPPDVITT